MKKVQRPRKLQLARQSVHVLTEDSLRVIVGGKKPYPTQSDDAACSGCETC